MSRSTSIVIIKIMSFISQLYHVRVLGCRGYCANHNYFVYMGAYFHISSYASFYMFFLFLQPVIPLILACLCLCFVDPLPCVSALVFGNCLLSTVSPV